MSRGDGRIRKERHGVVTLVLDPVEAAVIRGAFADLLALLDDRAAPDDPVAAVEIAPGLLDPFAELEAAATTLPTDPALARLLPDAYADDPQAAAEYRRFTERDLVAGKQSNIRTLLGTLSAALDENRGGGDGDWCRIRLDPEALRAWLYALNDLRLALGSRLQIEDGYEEQIAELPVDDPRLPHFALYEWLTGLQDALVKTQL